jgi:NADPH:quinone reductase-like Zn-dependent oxidoreductase
MRAAVYTRYGPPEVVHVTDIATPIMGESDLLIRVRYSSVNRTDCGFRSAEYFIVRFFSGLITPKNPVLGCEFAGEVESVGSKVTQFKIGDRVFGFNDSTFGGHGEYLVINEGAAVAHVPDEIPFDLAAAITEGGHYALCNLRAARLKAGQSILIHGATGAIGSAAVQLARYFGANVTAVCHGKHVDLVKSLGPDVVIDYTRNDFTRLNTQFDIVFDAVGKSSFGACKPILKEKGIYMSTELGKGSQNPFLALITPLLNGKRVLFPLPTISKEDVVFLRSLAEGGNFKPLIDRKYALDEIVEAYRYVETGQKTGTVLLEIT